jgi:hypothetical protein
MLNVCLWASFFFLPNFFLVLNILVYEEFEDTKGAIRIRISKKNRQHKGKKKKVQRDKQRSTKHTYKAKDRLTRTPLKTGGELRCSGRAAVPVLLLAHVNTIFNSNSKTNTESSYIVVCSLLIFMSSYSY